MSETVADVMWAMLTRHDVRRCNGMIEFISVHHQNYGAFAAVAEAYFAAEPAVLGGTAGAGTAHFFNGLMDARNEGAPVITTASDVETSIMDTS